MNNDENEEDINMEKLHCNNGMIAQYDECSRVMHVCTWTNEGPALEQLIGTLHKKIHCILHTQMPIVAVYFPCITTHCCVPLLWYPARSLLFSNGVKSVTCSWDCFRAVLVGRLVSLSSLMNITFTDSTKHLAPDTWRKHDLTKSCLQLFALMHNRGSRAWLAPRHICRLETVVYGRTLGIYCIHSRKIHLPLSGLEWRYT